MIFEELVRFTTNPSFRFLVMIGPDPIGAFTQCTLPIIDWDVLPVKEGGLNSYVHQLPGRRKQATLTLKNGLGMGMTLMGWYLACMTETYERMPVTVTLLNSLKIPVMVWFLEDCIPIKWTGPTLGTDQNTVAIQELTLACGEITVIPA